LALVGNTQLMDGMTKKDGRNGMSAEWDE